MQRPPVSWPPARRPARECTSPADSLLPCRSTPLASNAAPGHLKREAQKFDSPGHSLLQRASSHSAQSTVRSYFDQKDRSHIRSALAVRWMFRKHAVIDRISLSLVPLLLGSV